MKLPKISVNIPVITNGNAKIVLESLKKIDYPKQLTEIIIIEGNQIAKQRNEGLEHSNGDIIYMLDDDSQVQPESFKILAEEFNNPKVAAVGGPSLTPCNNGYLNQIIGYVLETYFGAFRMSHKWSKAKNKQGMDYHFIGANLAIRKKAAIKVGGFDEKIVPNEETELLRRLNKKGYILKYNKELFIYRNQRDNMSLLAKQFYHYGKGRMKQILKKPIPEDLVFTIPIFYGAYLVSLIFFHPIWYFLPLISYFLLGFLTSLKASIKYKRPDLLLSMHPVFLIIHLSYGTGLIIEMLKRFKKNKFVEQKGNLAKIRIVLLENYQEKSLPVNK